MGPAVGTGDARPRVVAFDIGGTRVKAAVVDGDRVLNLAVRDTPGSFTAAVELVRALAGELLAVSPAARAGVCVPGIVDAGVIVALPGKLPGAEGANIAAIVEEATGLPTVACNDAIAYGAGEAVFGAGQGALRVVVVTLGTGVGTAVFEDGRPLGRGPFGGGLFGGQAPVATDGGELRDTSGRTGTIEARCRAVRLVDYAAESGSAAGSPEEVFALAAAGEPGAVAGLERYRSELAVGLAALALAHAPEVMVVGGGPAGSPALFTGLEEAVNERLFGGFRVRVAAAATGDAAALLGLAGLAVAGTGS